MTDIETLKSLPVLPRPHYWWATLNQYIYPMDPRIEELARICGTITIYAYKTRPYWENVFESARKTNASLGIAYNPYENPWGWLTNSPDVHDPRIIGTFVQEELHMFRTHLCNVRRWLADFNKTKTSSVKVSMVGFSAEQFKSRPLTPENAEWNDALDVKNNAFYDVSKSIFPQATVEWFARGELGSPWVDAPNFTLRERGDTYGATQYFADLYHQSMLLEGTIANAAEHGVDRVTVWPGLGVGIVGSGSVWEYKADLTYSDENAWKMGRAYSGSPVDEFCCCDLNKIYNIIFYPGAFESPSWIRHFAAYVWGANGIALPV